MNPCTEPRVKFTLTVTVPYDVPLAVLWPDGAPEKITKAEIEEQIEEMRYGRAVDFLADLAVDEAKELGRSISVQSIEFEAWEPNPAYGQSETLPGMTPPPHIRQCAKGSVYL